MTEWINLLLFLWSSWYFLECHSLLKWCFQNGHEFELVWWSPLQLIYLNIWEQGVLCSILSLGRLILNFTLQHQANWWWCSDLWRSLHLMYLNLCALHENIAWPYFLHCGTSGFMFASLIVTIYLSILKHLLIRSLALLPLWTSQMSNQMITISDLGETLMMQGFEAIVILLNMWLFLMMVLTTLAEMEMLVYI